MGDLEEARRRLDEDDANGAIDAAMLALAAGQDPARAACIAGRAFHDKDMPEEALAWLDRSLSIEPSAEAFACRALIRYERDANELALADCARATELDAVYGWPHLIRGSMRHAQGRDREALEYHDRAVGLAYGAPMAHYNRGIARMGLADADGAAEDFTKALAYKEPAQRADAMFNLVQSLWRAGKLAEARAACVEHHGDERFIETLDLLLAPGTAARGAFRFRFYGVDPDEWQEGPRYYRLRFQHPPDAREKQAIGEAAREVRVRSWMWSGPFVLLALEYFEPSEAEDDLDDDDDEDIVDDDDEAEDGWMLAPESPVQLADADPDKTVEINTLRETDPTPAQKQGLPASCEWFSDLSPFAPYVLGANFKDRSVAWVDRDHRVRKLDIPLSIVFYAAAPDRRHAVMCDQTTVHVVDLDTGESKQLELALDEDDGGLNYYNGEVIRWAILAVGWVGNDRVLVQTIKRVLLVDLDGNTLAERPMRAVRAGLDTVREGQVVVLAGESVLEVCTCDGASFVPVQRFAQSPSLVYSPDGLTCYAQLDDEWREIEGLDAI